MEDMLIGDWKVISVSYKNETDQQKGLSDAFYGMYVGEIKEFRKGKTRWKKSKSFANYTLNIKDSTLLFSHGKIKILELNSRKLITQENILNKELITEFERVED